MARKRYDSVVGLLDGGNEGAKAPEKEVREEDFPKVKAPEKEKPLAEAPAPEPEPTVDANHDEDIAKVTELIKETIETDAAVSRNKKCKEQIKSLLLDSLKLEQFECEFGTATIDNKRSTSLDEEGLIKELKSRDELKGYVKTRTIEYVDMDAIEKAVYEEDGTDSTPITDLVRSYTSESITKALRVKAPKKETKKGGK